MSRTVAVLAGGLGTRVAHLTGDNTPKALLPVGGRPFIDLKLAELAAAGVDEIVMLVGHAGESLEAHIGNRTFADIPVRFADDGPRSLGTGGAIRRVLDDLPDPFWVTYGDSLLEVPMAAVERGLAGSHLAGVMTVLRNEDRWETSNVSINDDLIVTAYEKGAPPGSHHYIDYGMMLMRHEPFRVRVPGVDFDLGDTLRELVAASRLGAALVDERFHDIGSETTWRETDRWVRQTALWDRLQERIERRVKARDLPRP